MEEQGAQELSRLEEVLRRPDYVLEPSCMATIVQYIRARGTPATVVEMLSDGYVGTAHMASLMCQWLTSFTHEPSEADELADLSEEPDMGGRSTSPQLDSPSLATSLGASPATGRTPQDEATFLSEFVRGRFDPERVADVFVVRQGKPPPWLEGLTSDPRGRALVYSLSALHRNCLLLNFAIQKILMQGHEAEVAVVGASLASYFSVFHRLLAARLRAALAHMQPGSNGGGSSSGGGSGGGCSGPSDRSATPPPGGPAAVAQETDGTAAAALAGLAQELSDSCAGTSHTYLHAQQLLTALGRHPAGAAFMRLSQELEAATAKQHPVAWATQRMLLLPGSPEPLVEAVTLVGRCLSAPGPGLPSGDVMRLAALYAAHPAHLPLTPIQHPVLINQLIAGVFVPGKPPSGELVSTVLELLATATSAPCGPAAVSEQRQRYDPRARRGAPIESSQQAQPAPGDAAAGGASEDVAGVLAALRALALGPSYALFDPAYTARVDATRSALRAALALGQRTHTRHSAEDFTTAQQVAAVPVAAAALLHCFRVQFTSRDYWGGESTALQAAPGCLRVLLLIAHTQPQLLPQVVDLLSASLVAMGSQRAELPHAFSGALVVLMRDLGAVGPVMAAINAWADEADPSLVRHAMLQVLSAASPPYSSTFAQWVIRHMVAAGMRRKYARGATELLRAFAVTCQAMAAAPGLPGGPTPRPGVGGPRSAGMQRLTLSAKEQACLAELAAAR